MTSAVIRWVLQLWVYHRGGKLYHPPARRWYRLSFQQATYTDKDQ